MWSLPDFWVIQDPPKTRGYPHLGVSMATAGEFLKVSLWNLAKGCSVTLTQQGWSHAAWLLS